MNGRRRGTIATAVPDATSPGRRLPAYPPVNLIFLAIFIAFVLARYVSANERMDLLRTIRCEFVLGLTACVCAGVRLSMHAPPMGRARPLVYWMAGLFLAIAIQVPFAADQVWAPIVFSDRVFKFAMLSFLIAALVDTPKVMVVFLGAFLFSVFYITLESTRGLITGGLYWQNQGVMRLHGAVSQYGHPNSLGGVALGTLPFVIFLFRPLRSWLLRLGLLAVATTSMICVVYSGSRTSYVGLIALLGWVWFQQKRKLRALLIFLGVGLAVVPVIPHQYVARFESIGNGKDAEGGSTVARRQIQKDAIMIFSEHPFGVGVGSFPKVRHARFNRDQDTHNLYLEVATNLGIQGFIVFAGFVATLLMTFRRAAFDFRAQLAALRRKAQGADLTPALRKQALAHFRDLDLLVEVAKAGAGFIVVRLVLGIFGMDLYEIYWWFGSGLAISLAGLAVTTGRRTGHLLAALDAAPRTGTA